MIETIKQWALDHSDKLQIIPVKRLQDIRNEIEVFRENEDLNGFQQWITTDLYKFNIPDVGFPVRSIILLAIPHPLYANVEFERHVKKYKLLSLVMSDFDHTEKDLSDFLVVSNYHIGSAPDLPMKRLAVKSGLAVYGRNNVCYVEGMGSLFSFAAYYSDIFCDHDNWMEVRQSDRCANCQACLTNCPTGAIRKDRFLINNERCLSNLNESPGEFPDWLPKSVHHCLYDCLKCQIICPMNKEYLDHTIGPIQFNEEETDMMLSGCPLDAFSPAFQQKSKMLGLDQWFDNIPRNLKALFEVSEYPILD
jgi:epoxyqueuosine reductase